MSSVLLAEDEFLIRAVLVDALDELGMTCIEASTGQQALDVLTSGTPLGAIIVDIGLPRMDGLELVRRMRRDGLALPVLILTARDTLEDRVDALELGADDYLIKPFHLSELVARVRALIRRSRAVASSLITHGALTLDMATREAKLGDAPLALTGREWATLELLLLAAPRERSGAAGGLQGTARLLGQTAGSVLMALLFSLLSAEAAPRVGLAVAAALALAGGLVSALRIGPKRP